MIKKILSFILCIAVALTALCSCSTLASTKEESTVVLTVGDYEVPYELYYYITMNLKRDMPDATAKEIEDEAFDMLREIYAVFSVAEDFGIAFDDEYIASVADDLAKLSIDECGGKEQYKAALSENYMNDSVFRFLKRHSQTADELLSALTQSGKYPTGTDGIKALVLSDEFVCVKQIIILTKESVSLDDETYFSTGGAHTEEEALEIATKVRERAAAGEDFDALMKEYNETLQIGEYYISRGMWDEPEEEAVFALETGEVSEVVKGENGYSVFLACEKSESDILKNIDEIATSYYKAQYNNLVNGRVAKMEIKTKEAFDSYAADKSGK